LSTPYASPLPTALTNASFRHQYLQKSIDLLVKHVWLLPFNLNN
jgi:hypothetical protein